MTEADTYLAVKTAHMTFAGITLVGFVIRGWWMWRDSPLLHNRWTRILPHVNDSLLLAAGLWLAFRLQQYPLTHGWLTAKLLALIAYIVMGSIALKRGRTKRIRMAAFATSLLIFSYIVGAALKHNPWPWTF